MRSSTGQLWFIGPSPYVCGGLNRSSDITVVQWVSQTVFSGRFLDRAAVANAVVTIFEKSSYADGLRPKAVRDLRRLEPGHQVVIVCSNGTAIYVLTEFDHIRDQWFARLRCSFGDAPVVHSWEENEDEGSDSDEDELRPAVPDAPGCGVWRRVDGL